jgi:hypothetical protein
MSTRNGKIARLPKPIRDELARRVDNGEQGKDLVEWLNGLPAVQDVLKEQFAARAINEQNLSEWRQGGCPEWLRQEETRSLVSRLTEHSDDLDEAADKRSEKELIERHCAPLWAQAQLDPLADRYKPRSPSPNQAQSSPIKPNQGENIKNAPEAQSRASDKVAGTAPSPQP